MKNVQYARPKKDFSRVLRPIDLASLGIQSKETLVWSEQNRFCLVLNNKLSESLAEKLPNDFLITDAEGDEPDIEISDPLTSLQSPQGVVNDSLDDENDGDESSTLDGEEE